MGALAGVTLLVVGEKVLGLESKVRKSIWR